MSSIPEILGYSAFGSLIGLLAKELIDWGRSERAHTLELKKRYFDYKLDVTLKIAREAKLSTNMLRMQFRLLHDSLVTKERLNPTVWVGYCENSKRLLEQVSTETKGVSALLGFFYEDWVLEEARGISELMAQVFERSSQSINIMEDLGRLSSFLGRPDEYDQAQTMAAIGNAEMQLQGSVASVLQVTAKADESVDALIKRVSKTFQKVAF